MDTSSPEAWFKNLPVITRSLLVASFATTCVVVSGLFDPHSIILDWSLVTQKYVRNQIFMSFDFYSGGLFLGGFSFGFVMQLYFFTNFSSKLESHQRYALQTPGEYVYFLIVISVLVSLISLLVAWPRGFPLTGPSVIFGLIYYWSRCEPEARLSIWGFEVKGYQFPFALIFLTLLMGGDIWKDIVGMAAGHLYHFLKDVVPREYKMEILKTPIFFQRMVVRLANRTRPAPGAPAAPAPAAGPARIFVGGGYRLGGI